MPSAVSSRAVGPAPGQRPSPVSPDTPSACSPNRSNGGNGSAGHIPSPSSLPSHVISEPRKPGTNTTGSGSADQFCSSRAVNDEPDSGTSTRTTWRLSSCSSIRAKDLSKRSQRNTRTAYPLPLGAGSASITCSRSGQVPVAKQLAGSACDVPS